jgi:hypothetical protein
MSGLEKTASCSTLAYSAIFLLASSGMGEELLTMMASGCIPILLSSCTLCWVGFVLNSPTEGRTGPHVTCTNIVFSLPSSTRIWRNASKYGRPSMSPTVPPDSTTRTSAFLDSASPLILRFISFVMWGIIWTHSPK